MRYIGLEVKSQFFKFMYWKHKKWESHFDKGQFTLIWTHTHHLPGEEMTPGCTIRRREASRGSVMIWAICCWETSDPDMNAGSMFNVGGAQGSTSLCCCPGGGGWTCARSAACLGCSLGGRKRTILWGDTFWRP